MSDPYEFKIVAGKVLFGNICLETVARLKLSHPQSIDFLLFLSCSRGSGTKMSLLAEGPVH